MHICVCMFVYVCVYMCAQSLQSCLSLCDPMDRSLPGSSVQRLLQARTLEWVAVSSSSGFSQARARTHIPCIGRVASLPLVPPGKPILKERLQ